MTDPEKKLIVLDPALDWRISDKKPLYIEALYGDNRGLSVQPVPGEDKPLKDNLGNFGGFDYPSGLAIDRDNNVYIADANTHLIKKYDFCTSRFITLDCLGGRGHLPRQLDSPRGLTISIHNDLYIADTGNHRIQIFSLKELALRAIIGQVGADGKPASGSADGQFNSPTDIALDTHGNIYVVDSGNQRIQCFSPDGKFLRKFGEKGDGEGKFQNPTHIAIDRHDRIYVIDDTKEYIQVFDSRGQPQPKVECGRDVFSNFRPLAITIDNRGNVYIAEKRSGRIYRYSYEAGFEQAPSYIGHGVSLESEISYLMLDGAGNLYAALKDRGMVSRLDSEDPRYREEGYFISNCLDSQIYRCQWHRIAAEMDIPEGTSIEIYSYTSNNLEDAVKLERPDFDWPAIQINARDSLIQNPPGRYLWLKVVLKSSIKKTPWLKNLKVYYPRITYLRYLPRVYQEDESSRDFLEKFLSLFETTYGGFEDKITNIASYFNAAATPADFLPWLAAWLGLFFDQNWEEAKKRELIKLAPKLYEKRGTLEGLKAYIGLYTGLHSHLHIVEHFRLRRWLLLGGSALGSNSVISRGHDPGWLFLDESILRSASAIGSNSSGQKSGADPTAALFNPFAHRFSVTIPASFCDGDNKERAIRRILEVEKPAHTEYSICRVEPKFRVGVQSTIGVDTIIAAYPVTILGLRSTVGVDSILGISPEEKGPPALKIGKSSRIGVDTLIN